MIFHLAIPCAELDSAEDFYVGVLGCQLARKYADRITLNFFGHQLVCHLSPDDVSDSLKLYPRHFGMTFRDREGFDQVIKRVEEHEDGFLRPVSTRFKGMTEEHLTFFLADPSNNILEFKYYLDPGKMY